MYDQHCSSLQSARGLAFQSSCTSSQPSFGAPARVADWSRRSPVIQASRSESAALSGATLRIEQQRSGFDFQSSSPCAAA